MVNKKSTLVYIMLAIFLVSISLGCTSNKGDSKQNVTSAPQQNVTSAPQQNVTPAPQQNVTSNVTMSYPTDGSMVSVNEPLYGNSTGVYGSGLHLYVLINPVATSNVWWVQPEAKVSSDGTWNVDAQFGRSAKEDIGAKFMVTSIVTSDVLPLGQTSYPSNIIASTKQIQLTRK